MNYGQVLNEIGKWIWNIYEGGTKFFNFLFTPIAESITEANGYPLWIVNLISGLTNIVGANITPIALVGATGIIIAVVFGIIKAIVN